MIRKMLLILSTVLAVATLVAGVGSFVKTAYRKFTTEHRVSQVRVARGGLTLTAQSIEPRDKSFTEQEQQAGQDLGFAMEEYSFGRLQLGWVYYWRSVRQYSPKAAPAILKVMGLRPRTYPNGANVRSVLLVVPLWIPLLLFSLYPTVTLLRRRARRRRGSS